MSNHLYEIENNLQAIYDELEENGGELTEELASKLEITEDNLKEKLTGYCDFIGELQAKIEYCKTEEKRINTIRKQREKKVEWLKRAVLIAIQRFGSADNKGVKHIELNRYNLSNRRNNCVTVDDTRVNRLASLFGELVCDLNVQGCLYTGEDTDMIGILDSINAIYKAECDETGTLFIPYTLEDLTTCNIKIGYTMPISDYFRIGGSCISNFGGGGFVSTIEGSVNKTEMKNYFKKYSDSCVSYARPDIVETLTIK